jgi:hypothetical protein
MAAVDDEKGLQERLWTLAYRSTRGGELVELRALLEEHPEVNVDGFRVGVGGTALYVACFYGQTECARLLIDHEADVNVKNRNGLSALHEAAGKGHLGCAKLLVQNGADVNCQSDSGWTPLMRSASDGKLAVAQYLLEQEADVHYRISNVGYNKNEDALYCAMHKMATNRTPGITFAFLSHNTDAKNVKTDEFLVNAAMRDAHIETYSHVQAFIDESHRILNLVLSEHVPVDPRFGLGQMGIYQEPLERTLEYLGLSMSKNQVVNASIDGEAVRRALIPGHLLNANHWFDKYQDR